MSVTKDIIDIFSILHDGTISAWTGNKDVLTLTVDCEYLAERIDKSLEKSVCCISGTNFPELYTNPEP